jgi:hypothetical protein
MNKNKREHIREQKKALGKYLYDLSKLTYAALVLGSLLAYFQSESGEINSNLAVMLIGGSVMTVILAFFANRYNK